MGSTSSTAPFRPSGASPSTSTRVRWSPSSAPEPVRAGSNAFGELYTRYYPKTRGFCLRKTSDPDLAQDIAQEAFARAFQRIEGFGGPKRFGGWVGTIAANLVTDHFRRKSTTNVSLEQVREGERLPSYEIDPLASINRESVRDVVRPALDKLNARQREALLLHEGVSCAEIGRRLGISAVAAESWPAAAAGCAGRSWPRPRHKSCSASGAWGWSR